VLSDLQGEPAASRAQPRSQLGAFSTTPYQNFQTPLSTPLLPIEGISKVEEKSSTTFTTFSFSLSPGFLSFLRGKFSPFLYGKLQKKEQNTFLFLFLRVFSEKSFLFSPPPWEFQSLYGIGDSLCQE
jgi:hypothetical protein